MTASFHVSNSGKKKSENCGNRYMSKLFEKSMLLIIQSIDISAKHFVFSRIVSNGT